MASANINRCIFSGNLTRDVELITTGSGTKIAKMRLATNGRVKRNDEWVDKANYLDIVVFGRQGENCAEYLSKGSPVMVDAHADWSEWQDQQGNKRQGISFIADNVQFLSRPDGARTPSQAAEGGTPDPSDTFAPVNTGSGAAADQDIPF